MPLEYKHKLSFGWSVDRTQLIEWSNTLLKILKAVQQLKKFFGCIENNNCNVLLVATKSKRL